MKLTVFGQLFALQTLFKTEGTYSVDETYTLDEANPVVGGEFEDLIWVKAQDSSGVETNAPISRNRNFGNVAARYQPFFVQLGARLTF
jgi:hypothetical protein